MSTIFFAWELGGGLGHLMRIAPLAQALSAEGHRVFLAARDLVSARRVFAHDKIVLLPVPLRTRVLKPIFPTPFSFAHVLCNVGFGRPEELTAHVMAWRNLFALTRPDMIVFDHSPTALLAARGMDVRRVLIGSGFFIPPDLYPLPSFRAWARVNPNQLRQDEDRILQGVNGLLRFLRQPQLDRLAQFYADVDESILTTFRELDHYPARGPAKYWGPINGGDTGGKSPVWPDAPGKKIYAYLKPFSTLPVLLNYLKELRLPTLIFVDGIDRAIQRQFTSDTLRFETERLDISEVARRCDVAITHATLNTTSMLLAAGKPVLLLPLMLEQGIVARQVQSLGAGLEASIKKPQAMSDALNVVLNDPQLAKGAAALAQKFAQIDLPRSQQQMIERVKQMLAGGQSSPDVEQSH